MCFAWGETRPNSTSQFCYEGRGEQIPIRLRTLYWKQRRNKAELNSSFRPNPQRKLRNVPAKKKWKGTYTLSSSSEHKHAKFPSSQENPPPKISSKSGWKHAKIPSSQKNSPPKISSKSGRKHAKIPSSQENPPPKISSKRQKHAKISNSQENPRPKISSKRRMQAKIIQLD